MSKRSMPGVLLLALVCFFFTFASVSCNGQQLIAITGIQMVTGTTVSVPQMFGPAQVHQVPPEPTVIIAFLCGIAALGLSFLPGKKSVLIPAVLSAISVIALLIFKSNADSAAMRQTGGMIHPEFGNGFWGALIFYLGALVLGVVEARSHPVSDLGRSMPVPKCPYCGAGVVHGWKFCKSCAKPLEWAATAAIGIADAGGCPQCGTSNLPGTRYCKRCGQVLTGDIKSGETLGLHPPGPVTAPAGDIFSGQRNANLISTPPQPAPVSHTSPKTDVEAVARNAETGANRTAVVSRQTVALPAASVTRVEKRSALLVWGITLGTVVALATIGWYLWGVEVQLVTDPGGAAVVLDGRPFGKTSEQGGALVLPHLTHGTHTLSLTHAGFDEWSQPVSLGWFQVSHPLNVKLPVPTFPLTVLTIPAAAKVQMDGQDMGATDPDGKLVIAKVPRGQHTITVTVQGYSTWSNSVWVVSPASLRVDLAANVVSPPTIGRTYLRYVTPRGRNGLGNLLTKLRSTGGKVQLTKEGRFPSWSPTGELISYSGTGGIWMLDVGSGSCRLIIGGNAIWPSFSPDGLRVAYTRTDAEGIWLYDVASGGSRQLAARGGGQLRWSADAHLILSGTGYSIPYKELLITEVGSGRQSRPGIPGAEFGDFDWYSEDSVVMTRPRLTWGAVGLPNDAVGIFSLRGKIAGTLKTQEWAFSVTVSPRGQRIAYATGSLGIRVLDSTDGKDDMVWELGCSPTWSPDERILAADNRSCISYEIPQQGIWAILVEGK